MWVLFTGSYVHLSQNIEAKAISVGVLMKVSTSTEKNVLLFTVGEISNCGHLASSPCGGESGAEESSVPYGSQESEKGGGGGIWEPLTFPFKIVPQWCTLFLGLIFSSSYHLLAHHLISGDHQHLSLEGSLKIPKNTTPPETEEGANFLTQFGWLGKCLGVIFWLLIFFLALTFCTKSCV